MQPGGKSIRIFLRGDEFLHWNEDAAGYTILRDNATKNWVYATRDTTGQLTPSSAVVGEQDPTTLALPKRLLPVTAPNNKRSISASHSATPSATSVLPATSVPLAAPKTGTMKNLVLLVGFSDKPFTHTKAEYDALFNTIGYTVDGAQGSVKDYYNEVSYNQLNVESVVVEPVTLANGYAYYGANDVYGDDVRPQQMVQEALAALETRGFDFTTVDGDHDGWVDGLTVIHAGGGEEYPGNNSNYIWSHQWAISTVTYDGISMNKYHTEPELRGLDSPTSSSGITRIGVICHETGHLLGLPDLYDTGYNSAGIGNFCLMAGGSWNGDVGSQPAHMSAWCKKFLGWLTPITVTTYDTYSVPCVETNKTVYQLNGAFPSTQYFLVENRQGVGFDASMPGSTRGLLIWHVDENIATNSDHTHYKVDLEEASGTQHLEQSPYNQGDNLDYFRSGYKTTFNSTTTPNNRSYAGVALGLDITAVSASSATMTFTVPSPSTLQMKAATTSVLENAGSVWVYVSRLNGIYGAVSVNYATANGTALAGSDYTATNGTLTWADGDAADKSIKVTIQDDFIYENSETFTVSLSNVSGANPGSILTNSVTIIDNDSVPIITTQPIAQTILVGGSATFMTAVAGAPPFFYQWRLNGASISMATNSSYGIVNAQSNQAGQYSVVVTNAYGTATSLNALLTVQNALDHFLWLAIPNPQTSGIPFNVSISARDVYENLLTAWTNKATFSGAGSAGSVTVQPTTSGTFVAGQWTGSILIAKADNNIRLTASDGLGHTGTSSVFNVMSGPLHHFTWGSVASTQYVRQPFLVTIAAQDSLSNTCATFTGPVMLSGWTPLLPDDIEGGANGWTHSGNNDLWHISTRLYNSSSHAWYCGNDAGLYSKNMDCSLVSTTLVLSAGTRLSFQHWYRIGSGVSCFAALSTDNGVSYSTLEEFKNTSNTNGWKGQTYDLSAYTGQQVKIRFQFVSTSRANISSIPTLGWFIDDIMIGANSGQVAVAISPTNSGNFVNGVWNGAVSVQQAATNVFLKAYNSQGISGTSSVFRVVQQMLTAQGTPYLWLDKYNLVANANYAAAELTDTDKDGYMAWQEYVADTDPTNAASCFRIVAISNLP
ncbi:MAG: M6 family metalloprotease domain-containing protein, partial [bacterium]